MFQSKTIGPFVLIALSALCSGWGNPDSNFKVKRSLSNASFDLELRAAHPIEIAQSQNNYPNVPNDIDAIPPVPDAKNEVDDAVESENPQYPPNEHAPVPNAGGPPPDEEGLPPMTEGTPLKNIPTGAVNDIGLVGSYTTPGVAGPTTIEGVNFSISVSTSGTVEVSVTIPVDTTGTRPTVATATGTAGNRTSDGIPSEKMVRASNSLWILFGFLWLGLSAAAGLLS